MSGNTIGNVFRVTTWGESHGGAIGAVIDGCPPGLGLSEQHIQAALDRRKPGVGAFATPRQETDRIEILSGVFEGRTTGTPIALLIRNRDADSGAYDSLRNIFRPVTGITPISKSMASGILGEGAGLRDGRRRRVWRPVPWPHW
jgi:chorismate synthase